MQVVQVFWLAVIDIARNVQVVMVPGIFDLIKRDQPRVTGNLDLPPKNIHNLFDILLAQAVLVAVLDESLAGIDHEDAMARAGTCFVDDDDAGGNARAIEEIGRQTDDAFDESSLH